MRRAVLLVLFILFGLVATIAMFKVLNYVKNEYGDQDTHIEVNCTVVTKELRRQVGRIHLRSDTFRRDHVLIKSEEDWVNLLSNAANKPRNGAHANVDKRDEPCGEVNPFNFDHLSVSVSGFEAKVLSVFPFSKIFVAEWSIQVEGEDSQSEVKLLLTSHGYNCVLHPTINYYVEGRAPAAVLCFLPKKQVNRASLPTPLAKPRKKQTLYVVTLDGVTGASEGNNGRFSSFQNSWNHECGEEIVIKRCPANIDSRRGYGLTKTYVECLAVAMADGTEHAVFLEDDARLFPNVLKFCVGANSENIFTSNFRNPTFVLLLGGHSLEPLRGYEVRDINVMPVSFSLGTYAFMVPRSSIQKLMVGYQHDLFSGLTNLSPDISIHSYAADFNHGVYATIPLQCYHHSGISNTWGGDSIRPNITGYEYIGPQLDGKCNALSNISVYILLSLEIIFVAIAGAYLAWRHYRFHPRQQYQKVQSNDSE